MGRETKVEIVYGPSADKGVSRISRSCLSLGPLGMTAAGQVGRPTFQGKYAPISSTAAYVLECKIIIPYFPAVIPVDNG